MATNRRDVSLVIRAKDEASKAFESVAAAVGDLLDVNSKVSRSAATAGDGLRDLAQLALVLDKAYGKISGTADNAAAAFGRQETALARQRAELASLKAQADASARAMEALQVAIVDRGLAGDTAGQAALVAQLKAAGTEVDRLDRAIIKLDTTISANDAALDGQRSSLQQVGSLAIAAAEAQEKLAGAISATTRSQQDQARAAEVLRNVESSTGVSRDRGDYDQLVAQLRAESEAHDAKIAKLRAEQEAVSQLAAAEDARRRAAGLLPGDAVTGKSAKESASVFQEADVEVGRKFQEQLEANAAAARAMDAAAAKLRAQIDPMGEIQARLNVQLAEANSLYKAGRISAEEHAAALVVLRANADRAARELGKAGAGSTKATLFGLKPYDIQNLGYQINDIVTQLASGTSLTQTLAQQGGQLLQIFPNVGNVIAKAFSNPAVAIFAVAFGTFVMALKEAAKEEQTLRTFEGLLNSTADAAAYQATQLTSAAEQLDRYGLSTKDAIAVVRVFMKEAINPALLKEFGVAAKDMADVMGIDVKDAAEKVAIAFTGGYDAIKKLDDATNFLTAAERDHIKALFDANREEEARTEGLRIFMRRMDEGADKMRGPWTDAVRSMGNAWDAFMKLLAGTSVIDGAIGALNDLAQSVTSVLNRLSGNRTLQDVQHDLDVFYKKIGELNESIGTSGDPLGLKKLQVDEYSARVRALLDEQKKLTVSTVSGDTRAENTQAQVKATEDLADATAELAAKNKTLSDSERIAAAEKKAGLEADKTLAADAYKLADDAEKVEYKRQAIAQARRDVEKQITQEKEAQLRKDEQAIKSFSAKVPGVESSGNSNARPRDANGRLASSALGQGQFIEQTWLSLFRKHFPNEAARLGEDAILELRKDSDITKKLIEVYARDNADVLKKAGLSITEANLYLAHFLGPQGAVKILKAADGAKVSGLLGASAINANPSVLRGKTAGQVKAFAANKFGDASSADAGITQRLAQVEQDRLNTQARFDEKVSEETAQRRQATTELKSQSGLIGEALIAEQRKAAIADAVLKKQQEIDKINADRSSKGLPGTVAFSPEQRAEIEKTTAALFDAAHAQDVWQAKQETARRPVDDLVAQREALLSQIDLMQQLGNDNAVADLQSSLLVVNSHLDDAINKAIAFYKALEGNPAALAALNLTATGVQNITLGLQATAGQTNALGTQFIATGRQFNTQFAQQGAQAFGRFMDNVAAGKNVFGSLRDAFLSFAADFLRQIAMMIIQQVIFNAISGGTGAGGSGGLGGAIVSGIGKLFHSGGVAGSPGGRSRSVNPGWYANAMRYHSGGIAGLAPNEVPAILKKGEEVLTEDDPRHRDNGGGASGSDRFAIYNMFDSADVLEKGLSTRVGEKALFNWIKGNASTISGMLNG